MLSIRKVSSENPRPSLLWMMFIEGPITGFVGAALTVFFLVLVGREDLTLHAWVLLVVFPTLGVLWGVWMWWLLGYLAHRQKTA